MSETDYDALGRPAQVTDAGGGKTTYTYVQNDVLIATGPAPSGENTKQRQLEYDALGRLTSVCEITSAAGSGSCGQTAAATGFLTKYTHDALNNLTSVTQNAQGTSPQTRSYQYDGLSRLTSETNPESGTTAYRYDSDSVCNSTSLGDLVKRVDNAGNVTCYYYDKAHRLTSQTHPSGTYAGVTPTMNYVWDGATVNSVAMANAKGRIAEAYTGSASSKITDLGFSYTARGEVSDSYEKTPNSAGYYHVNETYWDNGLPNKYATSFSSLPSWSITPEGEGRASQIADSAGKTLASSTAYDLFGPNTLKFGTGDSDVFQHDGNTGRETSYKFTVGTSSNNSVTGNLAWNADGTLLQLNVVDGFTASNTQNCASLYDDLMRLVSYKCGSVWSQSFS